MHMRRRIELLPLGEGLVVQHVGMPAPLAIVRGKRISRPHRLQPRIFLQLRARHHRARIRLASASAASPRCRRTWCAACRPCACRGRTAWGSSLPRSRDRRWCRSTPPRGRNGFFASCLRSKMLISSAVTATVATAASTTTAMKSPRERCRPGLSVGVMELGSIFQLSSRSAAGCRGCFGVADRTVATRALQALGLAVNHVAVDGGRDVLVAAAAGALRHLVIELRDLDGVGIPPAW